MLATGPRTVTAVIGAPFFLALLLRQRSLVGL
jgi:ABC-type Fe3+-siderophore transport system permease subunit